MNKVYRNGWDLRSVADDVIRAARTVAPGEPLRMAVEALDAAYDISDTDEPFNSTVERLYAKLEDDGREARGTKKGQPGAEKTENTKQKYERALASQKDKNLVVNDGQKNDVLGLDIKPKAPSLGDPIDSKVVQFPVKKSPATDV